MIDVTFLGLAATVFMRSATGSKDLNSSGWIAKRHVPHNQIEEIVQDVFVRAYQSLPSFENKNSLSQWLSTIAQKDEIEKIMTHAFENIHEIMQKQQPELEKMVEDSLELIKEKLDPEQREKLARLKIFERMKQRMDPKHPPGRAMRPHGPHGFDGLFGGPVEE